MAEEQGARKGKSKFLIIIIAIVVLLLGGGGVAFFIIGSNNEAAESSLATKVRSSAPESAAYVNIPQPFLFNVKGNKKDRLVQIKVQMMVRGRKNEELARYHSPLVESTLLATFASATVEQLRSSNGRIELRNKATEDIKASLIQVVGQPVIEKLLFTDFVIQ